MTKYYAFYCLLLVAALAFFDARGYVLGNMFDSQVGGHGAPNHYHK